MSLTRALASSWPTRFSITHHFPLTNQTHFAQHLLVLSAFSFTCYNSSMLMRKVLPSRSPLKKRKHEALLSPPIGSPEPLKKKAVLQKSVATVSVTSVSDVETSPSVAAQALLKLSQAPMTNWVQHFEETSYSSSSEDEENSHSGENQMVKALVRATFNAAASKIVKKPDAHLQALVAKKSSNNKKVQYHKASDIKAFFEPVNDDKVQAFTLQLVKAVRSNDVTTVRRLRQQGHSMEACNKYGDSIVHLACRRNSEQVLEYLLLTREVSCKLACDYGRTPLHDACWTAQPNYNIIGMLLDACPDLLYIKDARGSTALEYLKKDHWQDMNRFLEQRPVAGLIARDL